MKNLLGRRNNLAIGWVALVGLVILLALFRVTLPLDLRILDANFKLLRGMRSAAPAREVAIVGIDEQTLREFPEPFALWHRHFGKLFLALAQVNPAAVGLDVVLPDRSFEPVSPGSDRELLRGLVSARQSYPLVLGLTIDAGGSPRSVFPLFLAAAGPDATGFVLVPRDADNVVRRTNAFLDDQEAVPSLVGQLARRLGQKPSGGIIDYSIGEPLDYLPMQDLLLAFENGDMATMRSKMEGKVVLVGPVLPFEDRVMQPVLLADWEQGRRDAPSLLVHAQAVRSIGAGPIQEVPLALPLILAVCATSLWFASITPARAIVLPALTSAFVLGGGLWLVSHRFFMPTGIILVGLWGASLSRLFLGALERLRQRRQLRGALAGYVGPKIVEEVMSGRLAADLGGRREMICVMFTDIRGFTPRSESMTPEGVVALLNRYFEEVIGCVHRHEGTVAQLMGDGMMAFFGAPNALGNPSRAAFAAAQEMFQRLETLNAQFRAENIAPIEIGIGLNSGPAVVGHVGARTRHEYTATGDVVNVAARLEGMTKDFQFPLLCSESVIAHLPDQDGFASLGAHKIKGHSSIPIYGWRPVGMDRSLREARAKV